MLLWRTHFVRLGKIKCEINKIGFIALLYEPEARDYSD